MSSFALLYYPAKVVGTPLPHVLPSIQTGLYLMQSATLLLFTFLDPSTRFRLAHDSGTKHLVTVWILPLSFGFPSTQERLLEYCGYF